MPGGRSLNLAVSADPLESDTPAILCYMKLSSWGPDKLVPLLPDILKFTISPTGISTTVVTSKNLPFCLYEYSLRLVVSFLFDRSNSS